MNTRIAIVICAFGAAAYGCADNKPAQNPTTVTNATTPSGNADSSESSMGTSSTTSTTTPRETTPAAERSRDPKHADTQNDATRSPSAPSANVVQDPGAADQTKQADNTKVNERDRHGALTPMNQGNSSDETAITAAIRRGIIADKSLSFTAKNVKVITVGHKVTLRGPVKSDQEKASIEAVAKQTAGVTEIDNQLEVKK